MSAPTTSDLLQNLLEEINSEADLHYLSDKTDAPFGKYNGVWQRPAYAIIDADGDFIGFGMSKDEAVCNAILQLYRHEANSSEEYRRAIKNYTSAMNDLNRLSGVAQKSSGDFED